MKLKLDENLSEAAASLFRSDGYDAETVRGQGLSGTTDRQVIAACQAERRCLVTLDLDFANPLLFDPVNYAGIAVLRLPRRPSHQNLLDACQTLIEGLSSSDITGRLWIIQRGRIREYQHGSEA